MCEYYILYKFKLSIAMQGFLRYHKCTCKYKNHTMRLLPRIHNTYMYILHMFETISSQVILHVFTSRKKTNTDYQKKIMGKDTEFKHIIYVFFNCNFFFLHFSRSLFLPHAWLRQHTRNPSGLFQTPLPSNRKGKYFCCLFFLHLQSSRKRFCCTALKVNP